LDRDSVSGKLDLLFQEAETNRRSDFFASGPRRNELRCYAEILGSLSRSSCRNPDAGD
jgi:hypothetical protein